ncbi:hypothetical protein SMICM17S_05192 [Streptomyces microflavus]
MEGHRLPERLHGPLGVAAPLQVRAERLEGVGQVGQEGVPLFPQQVDGLPRRWQRHLRPAGGGQAPGKREEGGGEARAAGLGALCGRLAVQGDGLLRRPETRRHIAGLVQVTGQAVQRRGQLRTEGARPLRGELAEAAACFLGRLDRPGGVAHRRTVAAEAVEGGGEPGEEGLGILLGEAPQETDRLLGQGHGLYRLPGTCQMPGVAQQVLRERRHGRPWLLLLDQLPLEPYGLLRERHGGRPVPGVGDAVAQGPHGLRQLRLEAVRALHAELGVDPRGLLRRGQRPFPVPGPGTERGELTEGGGQAGQAGGGVTFGDGAPAPYLFLHLRQTPVGCGPHPRTSRLVAHARPTVLVTHARPTVLAVHSGQPCRYHPRERSLR